MDLSDVEFSESEFEQAGLLYDTNSGLTAPPPATIAKTSGHQLHDVNSIRQPEPASLLSQASALPNPSEPWQVPVRNLTENRATEQQATHTRPEQAADASNKKAANREHQRRFRLRQKVMHSTTSLLLVALHDAAAAVLCLLTYFTPSSGLTVLLASRTSIQSSFVIL